MREPVTELGLRLRGLRKAKKWSQRKLAKEAGVAQGLVSLLESTDRPRPSSDVIRRLERALGAKLVDTDTPPSVAEFLAHPLAQQLSPPLDDDDKDDLIALARNHPDRSPAPQEWFRLIQTVRDWRSSR